MSKKSSEGGSGIISQKDMVLTQLAFMGLPVFRYKYLGVQGNYEQFDAFCHLWRVLGHLLGIEDRFNLCAETLEGTISRIEAVTSEILLPALSSAGDDFDKFSRSAFQAISYFNPEVHYESMLYFTKRLVGVPNYYYFQNEVDPKKFNNQENLRKMSIYVRSRLLLTIFMHQFLTKYVVIRWTLNIIQIFITKFLELFPIFAINKFGKPHAYVQIVE